MLLSFKGHSRLALSPKFAVGDVVRERFPFPISNREIGTVVKQYEFENQYRDVVNFASGREHVFFEWELLPIERGK
jgi:hypothetical protein